MLTSWLLPIFNSDSKSNRAVRMLFTLYEKPLVNYSYFVENNSTISVCSIDLDKAFDKMNKYALFIKLINKRCPIAFVNILDQWYDKMYTCVKLRNAISEFVKLNKENKKKNVKDGCYHPSCSQYLLTTF